MHQRLIKTAAIKLCNNVTFHRMHLRCINFNDWVIAFSMDGDDVLTQAILHTSRLVDSILFAVLLYKIFN